VVAGGVEVAAAEVVGSVRRRRHGSSAGSLS